jgi:predicted MFS family arabinose efflux permease
VVRFLFRTFLNPLPFAVEIFFVMISDPSTEKSTIHMAWRIGAAIFCRLLLNTSRRFAYPFAPVLSRGLGVSLAAVTSIIAVNQATAVVGVLFGPIGDRLGYRFMMLCGMCLMVLGMLWAGISPSYTVVLIALLMAGMAKTIFDPAIQAYIGRDVPYQHRGLAVGFLETSWAGSTLLGIPAMAFLINWLGWRAPFFAIGGLGLVGMFILLFFIPVTNDSGKTIKKQRVFGPAWRQLVKDRSAVGALGYAFWVSVANDNLFVVYGAWLEHSFDISIVALGFGTGIIGLAELCGEGITAFFSDRLGLKRSVKIGLILTVVNYLLLPWISSSLTLALTAIFLIFLSFEFTIVSSISLCTELLPEYRATMMSAFFATAGVGRVLGALLGGGIWLTGGIHATCLVSAGITLVAFVSLSIGLKRL